MKIEKLTENKIRVIVNSSDLEMKNLDLHLLMTKALEEQNFFANLLEKAKKEVGFNADGCKLLIEAFSSYEDLLVFTITKYSPQDVKNHVDSPKKRLTVKRKSLNLSSKQAIYQFTNFDEFCDFCKCIAKKSNFDIKNFSKNISLYCYHHTYYLLVKNINTSYEWIKTFYSIIAEFATPIRFSNSFENKLVEHGEVIMKRNAIITGIKYFVSDF